MAKKSKTQKAKASAARAAKKEAVKNVELTPAVEEAPKKKFFKKDSSEKKSQTKTNPSQSHKKAAKGSSRFKIGFLSDVRSEMRRVTWPGRQEVLQWTGVTIVALLFFGLFCVVLDDWVVTPILLAISGLGA